MRTSSRPLLVRGHFHVCLNAGEGGLRVSLHGSGEGTTGGVKGEKPGSKGVTALPISPGSNSERATSARAEGYRGRGGSAAMCACLCVHWHMLGAEGWGQAAST